MKNVIQLYTFIIFLLLMSSVNSQPVIADFQVNDNASEGFYVQQGSPILFLVDNNYLVLWTDTGGLWAQLFNSDGVALTDDYVLAERGSSTSALNDSGNIMFVSGSTQLIGHIIDKDGTLLTEDFRICEYTTLTKEMNPAIACGDSGGFIVTWDHDNPQGDILARRFAYDGLALGESFKVNDDANQNISQTVPDIASNAVGDFIITWNDLRIDFNTGGDIYAQRYDSDGNKLGSNFRVNDDVQGNSQGFPAIAINDSGYSVITWADGRDGYSRSLYAQRYDPDGNKIGDNFKVNDTIDTLFISELAVSINNQNAFIITWQDDRNEDRDIFAQYYNSDGSVLGGNIRINNDESDLDQRYPNIVANKTDDFILYWTDYREGYGNARYIYLQKIAANGSLIGGNFHPSSDNIMYLTSQSDPCLAIGQAGNFTVVWRDDRFSDHNKNIYAQRFKNDGTPIDSNFCVNERGVSQSLYYPATTFNSDDKLMVTWLDNRNVTYEIYAQLYDDEGAISGSNFKVDDDTSGVTQTTPDIAADNEGNFIIVWKDQRDAYDIYARKFDGNGSATGSSFKVNDDVGSSSNPCVAFNEYNQCLIAWSDKSHEESGTVYAQLYDSQGEPVNNNFKINHTTEIQSSTSPHIIAIDNGNFIVAWGTYNNIYAQMIADDGTLIDTTFLVGDGEWVQSGAAIASRDDGNSIITWYDNRNQTGPDYQWELFAQRYNSDRDPIGSEFKISTNNDMPFEVTPDVKLYNNYIYTVWKDDDRMGLGTGTDIWANVLDWDDPIGTGIENNNFAPTEFALNQNYPNPFNPKTVISYKLPVVSEVELYIYNILGQKIATLVSKNQEPGQYQINWDASGFASGIYFYHLRTADYSQVRKMMLLK